MPPWAAHAVVSWAECTWVHVEGETREEMGLGQHSPSIHMLPVGPGRRMLRLCTPLPRPSACAMFAADWRAGFGQHEHSPGTMIRLLLSRDVVFGYVL